MALQRRSQANSRLPSRLLQAVVDAGMLIAAADGELEDEELDALLSLVMQLSEDVTERDVRSAIEQSAEDLRAGWESRIRKLSRTVTDEDDRLTVLMAAATVMLADGELEEGDEYELFVLLAEAFDVDQEQADAIIEAASSEDGEDEESDDEDEEDEESDDEDDEDEDEDEESDDDEDEEVEEEGDGPEEPSHAGAKSGAGGLQPTTLRRGDRGPEIRNLQSALNAAGAGISIDGVFGPATERAVRSYQQAVGLRADGLVGARTREALGMSRRMAAVTHAAQGTASNAPAPRPAPNPPARRSTTSVGKGARGGGVTTIQSALANLGYDVAVDGIFGPGTERAVMYFQSSQGLAVDGIVGPRTWALLAPYAGAG